MNKMKGLFLLTMLSKNYIPFWLFQLIRKPFLYRYILGLHFKIFVIQFKYLVFKCLNIFLKLKLSILEFFINIKIALL
jgi:hypothetical protein